MSKLGNPAVDYIDFPGGRQQMSIPWLIPTITIANMAQAIAFFNSSDAYHMRIDLTGVEQVRLNFRNITANGSPNNPRLALVYNTAFGGAISGYPDLGVTEVAASCATAATPVTSGWINVANGAKISDCYVALAQLGGNGSASTSMSSINMGFR